MDADLNDIIQSCLELEPGRRPEGMAEVLEDLERRRRLCRRPWTATYLVTSFLKRNALTTGFAVVVVGLILLGLEAVGDRCPLPGWTELG